MFVKHILESIKRIESFMEKVSEESFRTNEEKQSAVIRQIEIIGEATKNLPESFRKKYKDVSWADIAKTRDKMIHHYFGVDLDIVWEIIKEEIPKLKKQIKKIKENELRI